MLFVLVSSIGLVFVIVGMVDQQHPQPYEILFSAESNERPPSMTWRYSEPRALTALEVLPLPLTSPILVNTLNMGDDLQVLHEWRLCFFCSIN